VSLSHKCHCHTVSLSHSCHCHTGVIVTQVSLAALTGEEVNAFRLEVARRMRTENWNDSVPWSSEAANKVIMVRRVSTVDDITYACYYPSAVN